MKKRFALFLALLLMSTLLSGMALGQSAVEKKGTLTVLVEGGGPAEKVVTDTAAEFFEKTGYEIIIDAVPYSGVYEKLTADIQAQQGSYDSAIVDVIWLASLARGLEPLNDVLTQEVQDDYIEGLVDGARYGDDILGAPVWANAKVLSYRKDWFADEKNKADFQSQYGYELAAPKTWEQYLDVAQFFTRDTDGDGVMDVYGTGIYGKGDGNTVASWLDHALQAGADPLVLDAEGNALVNQQPYVDSLNLLLKLFAEDKSVAPEALSMASSENLNMFTSDKQAMMMTWGHFANRAIAAIGEDKVGVSSNLEGSAGIGVVPGSWYQVVLKTSPSKDAAKEYVEFLYGKNDQFITAMGVAATRTAFEQYADQPGYSYLRAVMESLQGSQTRNRPQTPKWSMIEGEVLVPALQSALTGAMTPQAALDAAKAEIEELVK